MDPSGFLQGLRHAGVIRFQQCSGLLWSCWLLLKNVPVDGDRARQPGLGPCPDVQEQGGLGEITGGFDRNGN